MSEQNRLIALSRESIRTNRFHFEKMSLRSQKIFLLPLTKLYWGMQDNPTTHPIHISFTRDEIREWLGIRADNEHFGSEFRRYFAEMVMESCECDKRAYEDAYKRYFPAYLQSMPLESHVNTWTDYFSCYATVGGEESSVSGEAEVAGQTVEDGKTSFTIRWCSEVEGITTTAYRVLFRDDLYDITGINHSSIEKTRGLVL